jgi:hypothetical protein
MKKIEGFIALAPKIKSGEIEYCLWTDHDGALYVQIIKNVTETKTPGTHSNLLFRVSDYLNAETTPSILRGFNPETLTEETSRDNNDAGFVKAVLKHLFP